MRCLTYFRGHIVLYFKMHGSFYKDPIIWIRGRMGNSKTPHCVTSCLTLISLPHELYLQITRGRKSSVPKVDLGGTLLGNMAARP